MSIDSYPRVRPVEAFPVQQDGKTVIYLKDPLNFAAPLGLSPVGYFILSHFDGQHSLIDIQEAFSRQFGSLLLSDELKSFIELLDERHYLLSERFIAYQKSVIEEFHALSIRQPAHRGGVYKIEPAELKKQLDAHFLSPDGPGLPTRADRSSPPKAIVAPHIDFHRGGPAYAWAYRPLAESDGADLYIILGTSHCGGLNPFCLTSKNFATPLGIVETDKEFVAALQQRCREDLFADEYLHRGEHSIEFQVVYLKYIAQLRAELRGEPEKQFKIVPILVSSFHSSVQSRTLPDQQPAVREFLNVLQELVSELDGRRICFIAGVDLAHVGKQFGDREEITPGFLEWVGQEDQLLIDHLARLDAPGFFNEVAKDQDRRRICGFSPLYSLIHLLNGNRGRVLKYSQAFTAETGSAVTFTSMTFD
jgi:AmmeMemoRadiSam system protein B